MRIFVRSLAKYFIILLQLMFGQNKKMPPFSRDARVHVVTHPASHAVKSFLACSDLLRSLLSRLKILANFVLQISVAPAFVLLFSSLVPMEIMASLVM